MWNNWTVKFWTSFVRQQATATRKKRKTGIYFSSLALWWPRVLRFLWRLVKNVDKNSSVGILILSQERKFWAWTTHLCIGRRKHMWDVRSHGVLSNLSVVQNAYCQNVEWWANHDFVGYGYVLAQRLSEGVSKNTKILQLYSQSQVRDLNPERPEKQSSVLISNLRLPVWWQ